MSNGFELHVLTQIYDFVNERSNFSKKSELDQILDYFVTLNKGSDSDFKFVSPYKIYGDFGEHEFINIRQAPNFKDKERFLSWLNIQFNHQQEIL